MNIYDKKLVPVSEEFAILDSRCIDNSMQDMIKFCSGNSDCCDAFNEMVKSQRETYYLGKHPYKISEGSKDGYWRTYLPDSSKTNGRRLLKRKDRKDLINDVVKYWQSQETKYYLFDIAKTAIEERWNKGFIKASTKTKP